MSDSSGYEYARGNLLEQRNTYFYAKFQGTPFLQAWRASREEVLRIAASDSWVTPEKRRRTPTSELLEKISGELAGGESTHALSVLDRLVQRFEVTKRLHASYNTQWRPDDPDDYQELNSYIQFGEVLHMAYASTSALPYLNALLKCLDTLTAVRDRIDSASRPRLERLVREERQHIDGLARKLGVQLNEA